MLLTNLCDNIRKSYNTTPLFYLRDRKAGCLLVGLRRQIVIKIIHTHSQLTTCFPPKISPHRLVTKCIIITDNYLMFAFTRFH